MVTKPSGFPQGAPGWAAGTWNTRENTLVSVPVQSSKPWSQSACGHLDDVFVALPLFQTTINIFDFWHEKVGPRSGGGL